MILLWFYLLEKKEKVGMFPYDKFKDGIYTKSILITIGAAIGKLTIITFAPMFIMLTLQTSIEKSGFILIPMLIMAPLSTYISGKLLMKFPYKWIIVINMVSITLGLFLFSIITPSSPFVLALIASSIAGFGSGSVSQILLIILQEHYDKSEISIITSTHTFFRWLGNLIGISIGTFSLMFFSNKLLNVNGTSSMSMDVLYKQVYESHNDLALIASWNSVFHYIFLVASIIVFVVTIMSLTIGNGRVYTNKK
jgi:predicted MFS family arabinose efflux permease